MTASFVTHRGPWVTLVNMLVAVAALVISVIALASAPTVTEIIPPTPAVDVVSADAAATVAAIDGCTRLRGHYPC